MLRMLIFRQKYGIGILGGSTGVAQKREGRGLPGLRAFERNGTKILILNEVRYILLYSCS